MLLTPRNRVHLTEIIGFTDKIVIEVGTREGKFAGHILKQHPSRLHLIDCWKEQDPSVYQDKRRTKQDGWDEMYDSVVAEFSGNKEVFIHRKMSLEAAKLFPPEYADFIYIDADHGESAVYADIKAWWSIVKPGGWMLGHDYLEPPSWSGVYPAVRRWLSENVRELDLKTRKDKFPTWGVKK